MIMVFTGIFALGCAVDEEPTVENDLENDIIEEENEIIEEETEEVSERDYFYDMVDYTEEVNEMHDELISLSREVDFSEEWKKDVEEAILRLEEAIVNIEDTVPPSAMEEIHEEYLVGAERYEEGLNYYSGGAKHENEDMIKDAVKLFREGEEHINRGYTMLYEYGL